MNALTITKQTMSSKEIAKLTGKQHKHVLRDIRDILAALGDGPELDHQGYQVLTDARGYVSEVRLNQELTYVLMTGYNVQMRMRVVRRWMQLEEQSKPALLRNSTKEEFYPVTSTLYESRALENKTTQPYHYSNEMNMINRIILGRTAKQYRIDEDVAIRVPHLEYTTKARATDLMFYTKESITPVRLKLLTKESMTDLMLYTKRDYNSFGFSY
ncbi:Rha family transcriptional regulator [Enterobacter hormaechei]